MENKVSNNCEHKDNACCSNETNMCCNKWKKCHMMKKLIVIILIIIAFCLGSQWGQLKSEVRGGGYGRGGMMNWGGYNRYGNTNFFQDDKTVVDEIKVDVTKPVAPAVKQ